MDQTQAALPLKQVMFLCSGNYYRSRYAELVFNAQAEQAGIAWRAFSRGLEIDGRNPGPISQHTRLALSRLGISLPEPLRFPLDATAQDFEQAAHIVAVKEAEHRRLVAERFPAWLPKVEFWHVHDLDCCGPEQTISHLDREIQLLLERLQRLPA